MPPLASGMTDFNCQKARQGTVPPCNGRRFWSVCSKVGIDQCCCWLWVGQSNTPPVFDTSRRIALMNGQVVASASSLQAESRQGAEFSLRPAELPAVLPLSLLVSHTPGPGRKHPLPEAAEVRCAYHGHWSQPHVSRTLSSLQLSGVISVTSLPA